MPLPIPLTQAVQKTDTAVAASIQREMDTLRSDAAELRREKLDMELRIHQLEGEPEAWRARNQNFFSALAAETRKPSYGHHAKDVITNLLIRAQEAGLYSPEAA